MSFAASHPAQPWRVRMSFNRFSPVPSAVTYFWSAGAAAAEAACWQTALEHLGRSAWHVRSVWLEELSDGVWRGEKVWVGKKGSEVIELVSAEVAREAVGDLLSEIERELGKG